MGINITLSCDICGRTTEKTSEATKEFATVSIHIYENINPDHETYYTGSRVDNRTHLGVICTTCRSAFGLFARNKPAEAGPLVSFTEALEELLNTKIEEAISNR